MSIRHVVAALVVVLAMGTLVSLGWAAPGAPRSAGTKVVRQESEPLEQIEGRVKELDRGKHRLTLESKKEPLVLHFDRSTTVFIDGRLARIEELAPGMQVKATWQPRRGARHATWIEVNRPPSTEQLPETPAAPGPH